MILSSLIQRWIDSPDDWTGIMSATIYYCINHGSLMSILILQIKDISDVSQLLNTIKDKENALNILQVKMKEMETTILDLQEKINEKDQIIEAKNMATSLMSDSLSKKG